MSKFLVVVNCLCSLLCLVSLQFIVCDVTTDLWASHFLQSFPFQRLKLWAIFCSPFYVTCLFLKIKTLKFLLIVSACSCDATQFSRFFAAVMQFPVILRFFSIQNIEKFGSFQFQNQKDFVIHWKLFFIFFQGEFFFIWYFTLHI